MNYDDLSPLFTMLNETQIEVLKNGYDILLSNIKLDYQSDISVDNTILVVGENELANDFINKTKDKFNITQKPYIEQYGGIIGDFISIVEDEEIHTAQIVFFIKIELDSRILDKTTQLGIHFVNSYENIDSMAKEIENLIGDFTYENTILFDENKCQYHHRDKTANSYCSECESVCPTFAITKDDKAKELRFSNIDCIFCGKCVGICPSGAMQKANAPLIEITKAAQNYQDKIPLILSKQDIESFIDSNIDIKDSSVTPFVLPNINMLNEVYFISILQTTSTQCILYGNIESNLKDSIDFINDLYERICNKKAIYLHNEIKSYKNLEIENLPKYHYIAESNEFNREIFKERVKFLIKDNDYGNLANRASIKYTDLKIDSDNCTLCMSCVESCNTKALINSKDNFELLLNPSLCTACRLCVDICPESIIKMPLDGIRLNNTFFTYNTKAKDEPFKCVECGKIFASTKSIKKVQNLMFPVFKNDEIKQKSILCCGDCKVKIMFRTN
ncbi:4Fe-4S dicluster domain-containing protein [Helicobacter sp. MIT 99-5507]|uniref:4Fe-4S dicluster domain-containing protein n=1 Tax=Helicobacter sp. MIT 99-5507 TaxID=152489 RepID=UPI000E1E5C7A|nr:4Fe-4S binding protein [Helicobacter sp. MIT 99-5507]RDU57421.1 hypothetical protein CQA42_05680 [Helicobacter sp. MIT 99-5507]